MTNDFQCIIGVDPGAQGGIAVYVNGSCDTMKMPKDMNGLHDFFAYYGKTYKTIVFVEKLNFRRDDLTGGKAYRIQRLLQNVEWIKAALAYAGVPYVLCHPMTWQAKLNIRAGHTGEEKSARKARYKAVAQELYPSLKATLWNADALLIMTFGRYVLENEMTWVEGNLPKDIKKLL